MKQAARTTTRAVIINCSTKEQTTLALLSVLRHGRVPVTVIDCESTDGSLDFFRRLQSRLPFALASMPLRRHGVSLDHIFAGASDDTLLLLDSDAEILRDDVVPQMVAALGADAYGSGFLHRGEWLGADHFVPQEVGYYASRMWIPCVLLKVAPVKAALAGGQSFRARTEGNELARLPWLSNCLWVRFRVPGLRNVRLDSLRLQRAVRFGERPHYIYYDTGAALHDYLLNRSGLAFAALDRELWPQAVRHRHGVTRRALKRSMRNAADNVAARHEALARIASVYGESLPELRSSR